MTKRITIYLGAPVQRVLQFTRDDDANTSSRIAEVCERYLAILDAHRPQLGRREWLALCDALNGYWMRDWQSATFIWAEVEDTEGLGEKWGIDQSELAKFLKSLSAASIAAVVETVQRFWAATSEHRDGNAALAEALKPFGVEALLKLKALNDRNNS